MVVHAYGDEDDALRIVVELAAELGDPDDPATKTCLSPSSSWRERDWHETFSWRNEDDLFGLDSRAFTYRQLLAMAGSTTRLSFDLRGGDVRYEVTADLTVRGVRGTCAP